MSAAAYSARGSDAVPSDALVVFGFTGAVIGPLDKAAKNVKPVRRTVAKRGARR